MQIPLEIRFHNLDPSPSLESEIRDRASKLDQLYDRLIGCRVAIEAPHRQHRTGNVFEVHIELSVPGSDLVVSREPHKVKLRYANPDVRTSLRDAFKAAERQLKDFKQQIRGDVKLHDPMFQGQIARLDPEADHGFLLNNAGSMLYFHRNSVMGDGFDALKLGDAVHYVEVIGDTGPIASKVWTGPEHHMD
jgi:ribosome-associated translation inhibitor RaiA/cold shock CspA family protein